VLEGYYGADHQVVVYEAAPYAIGGPVIQRLPLGRLLEATITDYSTLYVPPAAEASIDAAMAARLGIRPERIRG
jgi:hypothetical protein